MKKQKMWALKSKESGEIVWCGLNRPKKNAGGKFVDFWTDNGPFMLRNSSNAKLIRVEVSELKPVK